MDAMGPAPATLMPRRGFLGAVAVLGLPRLDGEGVPPSGALVSQYPQNESSRVEAVVSASHRDIDRVRSLVLEQPALAKASWDWGFGDWESALGAASHMGRREIAEFLIGNGARPTLFSASMMGDLPTVQAFLAADPGLFHLHGPHGISLMRHARAGRADAEHVVDYLLDRFGPDEAPFGFPGDATLETRYGGLYRFESGVGQPAAEGFQIAIGVRNDLLMIGVGDQPTGRLLQVEPDVFHPTGAPAVRLRFLVEDGIATALTIEDGPVRLTGGRVR